MNRNHTASMTDERSGLFSLWQRPITKSFIFYSLLSYVLCHLLLWIGALLYRSQSFSDILINLDSGWYSSIIDDGYVGDHNRWAFFPLYPLLARLLHRCFLGAVPTQIIGTLLSTFLFLASISLLLKQKLWPDALFTATTRLGWLLFLFSPASYIFHSHHTESLFLFLSVCSFYFASTNEWLRGSIFAGFAAVTRIPGIFVAMAVGCMSARKTHEGISNWTRLLKFVGSGLIAGTLLFFYWRYATNATGDPWFVIKKHADWCKDGEFGLIRSLRTLWFGNKSQSFETAVIPWQYSTSQYLYFLLLCAGTFGIWKRNKSVALYASLCLVGILMQGNFHDTFRVGAVLFPVFFYLGAQLTQRSRPTQWAFVVFWCSLNILVALRYALRLWAY